MTIVSKIEQKPSNQKSRIQEIIKMGREKAENLPPRSEEEIWQEFNQVWAKIAEHNQDN